MEPPKNPGKMSAMAKRPSESSTMPEEVLPFEGVAQPLASSTK
jgi:hypothetical protein